MKRVFLAAFTILSLSIAARATDFYVATSGNDANPGAATAPFRTIQRAADVAQPGDTITVRAGVYRERVSPPRGGTSDAKRIVYQAAPGEKVVITGSDEVKNWVRVRDDVWKVTLPNSFFGAFNPYSDILHGDWFLPMGSVHHTGAVYLDGSRLTEAASRDDVMKPLHGDALWFGRVDSENTAIWAQFKGDPNRQRVEINVRQTVFYPRKTGINYITVRGFTLEDAATPWAPPTAEQIGVIGPHWSKGWIIEDNVVRNSICSGISLGKYGDRWDNKSGGTAQGYVMTIRRALAHGWSKQNIGHHIVRDNLIYDCGQAGIVGSLGAVFSTITGNTIHDIYVRRQFWGFEMAGIKIHGAIDVQIAHNYIYRTPVGVWLDWMSQGARVSGNLFADNDLDADVEVGHGPFLFSNNIFLSPVSLWDLSQGGAYVQNLFAGKIVLLEGLRRPTPFLFAGHIMVVSPDHRQTPFLKPHSTAIAGFHDNPIGDDRYYNNLFVQRPDLHVYDQAQLPMHMSGNVFLDGAQPSKLEKHPLVRADFNPDLHLVEKPDGAYLEMRFDKSCIGERPRPMVTSALLGKAVIPDLPYEQPDGAPIRIDTDYFGRQRKSNPTPGPFADPGFGDLSLKVWPLSASQ